MTGPRRDAALRTGWALAIACLAAAVTPAAAQETAPARTATLSVLAGGVQPVARMADYQWDLHPHAAWGGELLAGRGRLSAGVRFWHAGTTQSLAIAGVPDPAVHANSLELLTRMTVARGRWWRLSAFASAGRLSLTWTPDRVTVPSGGGPVEVAFTPVHEWVGGAGLGFGIPLTPGWETGFQMERRAYALDTAHRSGSNVVEAREWFGDWTARVSLARTWDW